MLGQEHFVVIEDAGPDKFSDYEATHGLPKFIGRRDASPEKKTNLLTVRRTGNINFSVPKHAHLAESAYLLWR
jgi:hypothetical protein